MKFLNDCLLTSFYLSLSNKNEDFNRAAYI
jgi:hypothetical protein